MDNKTLDSGECVPDCPNCDGNYEEATHAFLFRILRPSDDVLNGVD